MERKIDMKKYRRIALIPAYEPTEILIDVVRKLYEEDFRIIVVNDGSSSSRAVVFNSIMPYAEIFSHSVNKGKGEALKSGFRYIEETTPYDCVVATVDADGQHCVEDVIRCCEAAEKSNALVLGSRHFTGDVPLKSMLGNTITRVVCRFVGLNVFDTQTGLRAFRSEMIPVLLNIEGERYEYEMNMLLECNEKGIKIDEVEIETVYIDGNSSSHFNPLKDSYRIYKRIIKFAASSIIGFITDYLLFTIFAFLTAGLGAGASLTFSNIAARICSCSVNYSLNRNLVFKSKNGVAKSAAQYFALAAGIMLLNTIVLNVFVGILGVNVYLAKILVELLFFSVSWIVQQKLIFKQADQC